MIEDLEKFNNGSNAQKISDTVIYKYLEKKGSSFYCNTLNRAVTDVSNLLTRIPAMFSNYTNHDITHSLRIADYMVSLLPQKIENYSDTELVVMLMSAIYHDIGMCVSETEGDLNISKQDEIRKEHHKRSELFIKENANTEFFKIDDSSEINFKNTVALIARAHGEDINWIRNNLDDSDEFGIEIINPRFISCLLRLGDYLDFDSRRTPYCLYNFLQLKEYSYNEWTKHFVITNYNKVDKLRQIYFKGECENSEIYHQILNYFRIIEEEIENEKSLLDQCPEKYRLDISSNIINKIKHSSFETVDLQYKMDYVAISDLLMGENLYSDKTVVIRELLQNSIDACLVKKELCNKKSISYSPKIKVIVDENTITISDNGIGMTKNTIENYFLCVGKSFYNSPNYSNLGCTYIPISHYGIGFLSCFLLSDKIEINTVPFDDIELSYNFFVEKRNRDVLIKINDKHNDNSGTKITFVNNFSDEAFGTAEIVLFYIKSLFLVFPVQISVYKKEILLEELNYEPIDMTNRIDISKYLNDIECSFKPVVHLHPCKIFESFSPFSVNNTYIYDPKHFPDTLLDEDDFYEYQKKSNNFIDITDFALPDNKVQILRIYPIVDYEENMFSTYLEMEDDSQQAFDRFLRKFPQEPINILIEDSELLNEFEEYELIDIPCKRGSEKYKNLIEKIGNLIYRLDIDTDSFICTIDIKTIYSTENFYCNIKLDKEIKSMEKNILSFHNMRVSQYRLLIPTILESFMTSHWIINVNTPSVYPSISRDTLSGKISGDLSYALGYAFNMYLRDQEKDQKKKEFINTFIQKYYSQDSIFIKRDL